MDAPAAARTENHAPQRSLKRMHADGGGPSLPADDSGHPGRPSKFPNTTDTAAILESASAESLAFEASVSQGPLASTLSWGAQSDAGKREAHEDRYAGHLPLHCAPQELRRAADGYGIGCSAFEGPQTGEEVLFYGVFDGHGGSQCAEEAVTTLHGLARSALQSRSEGSDGAGAEPRAGAPLTVPGAGPLLVRVGQALCHAFLAFDNSFLSAPSGTGGTTALAVAFCRSEPAGPRPEAGPERGADARRARPGTTGLVVAHVGDCRAVLCRGGRAVALTRDHRPDDPQERARILRNGGSVVRIHGVWRATTVGPVRSAARAEPGPDAGAAQDGQASYEAPRYRPFLAMSRCLGDPALKRPRCICTPEPEVTLLPKLEAEDAFLVLVSDGVTDAVSDQEVVAIASAALHATGGSAPAAARAVADAALENGSLDNVTAVVIALDWERTHNARAEDTQASVAIGASAPRSVLAV